MNIAQEFIENVRFEFERYKTLGDKTLEQLFEEELHWSASESDNSIAVIIKHMAGNMLSRWTNFLNEDGEKSWRNRDSEFENAPRTKEEIVLLWNKGWNCLFDALTQVNESNFGNKVKIRNENHSIIQAVHRQLAHYASHIGQIVYIGKSIKGDSWQSLSIPRGQSDSFNKKMFGK